VCGPLVDALPGKGWELWLDGGKANAAGGEVLASAAAEWRDRPLGLVVGMLRNKNVAQFLKPLAPCAQALRAVTIPGEANSMTAELATEIARSVGHNAEAADSPLAAVQALVALLKRPSRIIVCGSLYLAGKVLAENG